MFRRGGFHDLLAGPAAVFGTVGYDHVELRRDDVEPFGGFFADHVHRGSAAWAVRVLRRNRLMDARQMGGQCTAIGLAVWARRVRCPLLLDRFIFGDRLLDVFQRQVELIGR